MTSDKSYATEQRLNALIADGSPLFGPWQTDLGSIGVSGWAFTYCRYRWHPSGGVEFDISAVASGSVGGFIAAFPNNMQPAYRPARTRAYPMGIATNLTSTSNNWPRVVINTAGTVTIGLPPSGGSGVTAGASFVMPLD